METTQKSLTDAIEAVKEQTRKHEQETDRLCTRLNTLRTAMKEAIAILDDALATLEK